MITTALVFEYHIFRQNHVYFGKWLTVSTIKQKQTFPIILLLAYVLECWQNICPNDKLLQPYIIFLIPSKKAQLYCSIHWEVNKVPSLSIHWEIHNPWCSLVSITRQKTASSIVSPIAHYVAVLTKPISISDTARHFIQCHYIHPYYRPRKANQANPHTKTRAPTRMKNHRSSAEW